MNSVEGCHLESTGPILDAIVESGMAILHEPFTAAWMEKLVSALADLPAVHAHRNLLEIEEVRRFATCAEAMRLIQLFLGGTAIPVRGILFDKLPEANWKVPWHQDLSIAVKARHDVEGYGPWSVKEGVMHVQPPAAVLENMLTLRLHVDDCFEDNGPLRVLPGTHTLGILAASRIEMLRREIVEQPVLVPAGGVLLIRPLLLHASSAALTPRHRRVVHIEYAAMKLPEPLEWQAS